MTDPDSPAEQLPANLYALVTHLHLTCNADLIAAIQRSRLTLPQLELLDRLAASRRRPTISQAAAMLHLSLGSASRLIDDLAKRGMVMRQVDDSNFRRRRVQITPAGEQALADLHACRLEHTRRFANELPGDHRAQLANLLDELTRSRRDIAERRPAAEPAIAA